MSTVTVFGTTFYMPYYCAVIISAVLEVLLFPLVYTGVVQILTIKKNK